MPCRPMSVAMNHQIRLVLQHHPFHRLLGDVHPDRGRVTIAPAADPPQQTRHGATKPEWSGKHPGLPLRVEDPGPVTLVACVVSA